MVDPFGHEHRGAYGWTMHAFDLDTRSFKLVVAEAVASEGVRSPFRSEARVLEASLAIIRELLAFVT